MVLLPIAATAKLHRIAVQPRPGTSPRGTQEMRAHHESRMEFMSKLQQLHNFNSNNDNSNVNNDAAGLFFGSGTGAGSGSGSGPGTGTGLGSYEQQTKRGMDGGKDTHLNNIQSTTSASSASEPRVPVSITKKRATDSSPPGSESLSILDQLDQELQALQQKKQGQQQGKGDPNHQKRAYVGVAPVRGNPYDTQWVAAMSIGTPAQEFSVVFDTGSSDLWVTSTTCQSLICMTLRRFNPSRSSTFAQDGRTWLINYADDSRVSGALGVDDMSVAGIPIKQQTFGMAAVNTGPTAASGVDGIMGLGFDSNIEIGDVQTPVTTMMKQEQIDQEIVSVWLNKASNQDEDLSDGGEFIFGGVDPSLYTGPITYVPVTSNKEWQVTVEQVFIGRKELQVSSSARSAIVDTGSSYILFPDYLATAFHRAIPNSQYDSKLGWLIPCALANSRTVGDLTFVFGGQRFSVPISDIVILKSGYNGYRLSAIDSWQELEGHGGQAGILLGDLFIKNQYVVYDYGKRRIGFAKKVETAPGGIGLNAKGAAGGGIRGLVSDSRSSRVQAVILSTLVATFMANIV